MLEHWLVDPERESVEIAVLAAQGRYTTTKLQNGLCESRVLKGFWIRAEWLWQEPLPKLSRAIGEWNLD